MKGNKLQTKALPNLTIIVLYCQLKSTHKCRACGSTHFWKHGFYRRKNVYSLSGFIDVQRCKCCKPGCKKTFSILPTPLLPYSRFSLWHLLQINECLQDGVSPYQIAKHLGMEQHVILRLKAYLVKVKAFISQTCQNAGHSLSASIKSQCETLMDSHKWFDLTWKFFHAIYPLRFPHIKTHTD